MKIDKLSKATQFTAWKAVKPGATEAEAIALSAWIKRDKKAKRVISTAVSDEHLNHFQSITSSNEMWLTLDSVFGQKSETSMPKQQFQVT